MHRRHATLARAVLITLTLPRIHELMTTARIEAVYVATGQELGVGARLADITVDLSSLAAQDCPPISHYRLLLRERLWVRELAMAAGDDLTVGALLARFSQDPHEPLVGPAREARVSMAGILPPAGAWGGLA
jgi:hypothetical protein